MKNIITVLTILISTISYSQEFLPTSTTNQIVKHTYYSLSYSEAHEQAEWVYYILTKGMVQGVQKRKDQFRSDPSVTSGSATLKDYKGSGYDRGHLCPAADMKMNNMSMSESFYMSNMSPQEPSFNRGIWKKLEAKVRDWALEEDTNVVTGGVLTSSKGTIGANEVTVPKYYYKVIYDPTGDEKMIALILPNEKSNEQLVNYVVSVDSVEKLTGIDFFPDLDDEVENRLESELQGEFWRFN